MRVELMFPSKYLRAADFQNKEVSLTIKAVKLEEIQEANGSAKKKGIIYFNETPKALVANRTNALCIAGLFGPETDAWVGKRLTLYPAPFNDPFSGEKTVAIRVKGSPDLTEDKTIEIRLPRKNPIRMTMKRTGQANGKAVPQAQVPTEPAAPPEPEPDPVTGEIPFN